jgi:peroxiredoxin family protein
MHTGEAYPTLEHYQRQIHALTTRIESLEGQVSQMQSKKKLMIFLCSGTLDRAVSAFTTSNLAVATGYQVDMFCTLWAISLFRKHSVFKDNTLLEKAAKIMLRRGPNNAVLSHMHMFGMGTAFMKKLMKQHNFSSLDELIKTAMEIGVQIYICDVMMNMMGVRKEELIDGVHFEGGMSYIKKMSEASTTLVF